MYERGNRRNMVNFLKILYLAAEHPIAYNDILNDRSSSTRVHLNRIGLDGVGLRSEEGGMVPSDDGHALSVATSLYVRFQSPLSGLKSSIRTLLRRRHYLHTTAWSLNYSRIG